jgi:hypothetical protein
MDMFEVFLDSMHLPHYSYFSSIKANNDTENLHHIIECCEEFIEAYVRCNITDVQKYKMIEEYGMKKLIDLQVSYEGNSICLELLHLDEHIDQWIRVLLMNVITLS